MPRTTGVDILSIKPDPEMGLAQDSNIPAVAVALDQVNKANQDIRDYDHQRQLMKYDHQLKDRDNLVKGLHEGEISTGAILPEDREAYNQAEQEVRKAFLDVTSDEPDAKGQNVKLENYHEAKQKLQDLSTMLQSRYAEINKKRAARASTNLPSEQKALDADIDKWIKAPKMEPVQPFQKPFTVNPDEIAAVGLDGAWESDDGQPLTTENTTKKITTNAKGTTVQTTTTPSKTTVGKNGKITPVAEGTDVIEDGKLPIFTTTPGKKLSPIRIYNNIEKEYNNPSKEAFRVNVERTYDMYQGNSDPEAQNHFLLANARLAQMDQENGVPSIKVPDKRVGPPDPSNPNDTVGKMVDTGIYPSEINYREVNGKMVLQETPVSLAAKLTTAFAPTPNYVVKGQKYIDKDNFKLNLDVDKYKADLLNDKNKRALEWSKFGLDKDKFNATNHEDFASAASVINEATSIINKGEPVTLDLGGGKTATTLRISDPTLLSTFGRIDKDGNVTNVPDVINYDKDKNQAVLIYYNGKTASGKNIVEREVPLDQRTWLKHITKRSFPNKEIGNVNALIDDVLNKNNNSLYDIAQKGNKQTANTYSWNGNDYSEDEIKQAAAAEKLTQDAYMKKHGIKKK